MNFGTANWVIMRSFHCLNLVGIGCNADFLSRFKVINPETLKFTERDKEEFNDIIQTNPPQIHNIKETLRSW